MKDVPGECLHDIFGKQPGFRAGVRPSVSPRAVFPFVPAGSGLPVCGYDEPDPIQLDRIIHIPEPAGVGSVPFGYQRSVLEVLAKPSIFAFGVQFRQIELPMVFGHPCGGGSLQALCGFRGELEFSFGTCDRFG